MFFTGKSHFPNRSLLCQLLIELVQFSGKPCWLWTLVWAGRYCKRGSFVNHLCLVNVMQRLASHSEITLKLGKTQKNKHILLKQYVNRTFTSCHCNVDVQKRAKNHTYSCLYFSSTAQGSLFSLKAKKLSGHLHACSSRQPVLKVRPLPWLLLQGNWTLPVDIMPFHMRFLHCVPLEFRSPTSQFISLITNQDLTF